MSQCTCLVAGENPEEMLAPFDRSLDVEPYRDYEGADPAGHWCYRSLRADGLVSEQPPWEEYAAAYNGAYGEDGGSALFSLYDLHI